MKKSKRIKRLFIKAAKNEVRMMLKTYLRYLNFYLSPLNSNNKIKNMGKK